MTEPAGNKFTSQKELSNILGIGRDKMRDIVYKLFPNRKARTLLSPREVKKILKEHNE